MSHTTTLSGLIIKDKKAIRSAVADLVKEGIQIELIENAQPRMYYQHQAAEVGKCDFVLKLPGSRYDVGLKWNADEDQYNVFLDTWGGDVARSIGATCPMPGTQEAQGQHAIGRFSQRVAIHQAKNLARKMGQPVREKVMPNGDIQLVIAA